VLARLLGQIAEAERELRGQVQDRETRPVAETRRFRAPQHPSAQNRRDSAPPCSVLPRDLSCRRISAALPAWRPHPPPRRTPDRTLRSVPALRKSRASLHGNPPPTSSGVLVFSASPRKAANRSRNHRRDLRSPRTQFEFPLLVRATRATSAPSPRLFGFALPTALRHKTDETRLPRTTLPRDLSCRRGSAPLPGLAVRIPSPRQRTARPNASLRHGSQKVTSEPLRVQPCHNSSVLLQCPPRTR